MKEDGKAQGTTEYLGQVGGHDRHSRRRTEKHDHRGRKLLANQLRQVFASSLASIGVTMICSASSAPNMCSTCWGRSPTRICSGPPNGARSMTCTCVSGYKPN